MTAVRLELFDFESERPRDSRGQLSVGDVEQARLGAFERGYSAGWEDAVAAQDNAAGRLRDEVAAAIRQQVCSYEEAGEALLARCLPVLSCVTDELLPKLAHLALPDRILAEIEAELRRSIEVRVVVQVAPGQKLLAEALTSEARGIEVRETESLQPGQVVLTHDAQEYRFDSARFTAAICDMARAYLPSSAKEALA